MKDTKQLPSAYYRAGIREYWIVDARSDPLRFRVLVRGARRFSSVSPARGWLRSQVFGHAFRLERRRDRVGGWRYTLHVKAP